MDEEDDLYRDLSDMLAHESENGEEEDDDVDEEEDDDGAEQVEQARRVVAATNMRWTRTVARRNPGGKAALKEAAEEKERAAAVRAGANPSEAYMRSGGTYMQGASRRPTSTAQIRKEERAALAEAAIAAASDKPLKYREMETERLRKAKGTGMQRQVKGGRPLGPEEVKGRYAMPPAGKGKKARRYAAVDADDGAIDGAGGGGGLHFNGPVNAVFSMSSSGGSGNSHSQSSGGHKKKQQHARTTDVKKAEYTSACNKERVAASAFLKGVMKRGLPDKVFAQGLRDMEPPRSGKEDLRSDEDRLWAVREHVFKRSPQYKTGWLASKRGKIHIYDELTREDLEDWIEQHCGVDNEPGPWAEGRISEDQDDDEEDSGGDDRRDDGNDDREEDGPAARGALGGADGGAGAGAGGGGQGSRGGGGSQVPKKPRTRPGAPACAGASAPLDSSSESGDTIIPLRWCMDSKAFTPYVRPTAPDVEEPENIPPVAPSKNVNPPLKKGHVLLQKKGNQAVTGPANKPKYLVSRMAAGQATWK